MSVTKTNTDDNCPARFPRRLLLVPAIGCLLAAVLLFPFPMNSRVWNSIFDLSHGPSFFFVTLLIVGIPDPAFIGAGRLAKTLWPMTALRLWGIAFSILAVGALCEFGQGTFGRSPSLLDAAANSAGVMAACCLLLGFQLRSWSLRILSVLVSLGLLIAPSINPALEIQEALVAESEFPMLASFERQRELGAWQPRSTRLSISKEWSDAGESSLRIDVLTEQRWPGVSMKWVPPDWSGYQNLQLTFKNPQPFEVKLSVHVGDLIHTETGYESSDRFQREIRLLPSSKSLMTIPLSEIASAPKKRTLDLKRVAFLNIAIEKKSDLTVFLDSASLTNATE